MPKSRQTGALQQSFHHHNSHTKVACTHHSIRLSILKTTWSQESHLSSKPVLGRYLSPGQFLRVSRSIPARQNCPASRTISPPSRGILTYCLLVGVGTVSDVFDIVTECDRFSSLCPSDARQRLHDLARWTFLQGRLCGGSKVWRWHLHLARREANSGTDRTVGTAESVGFFGSEQHSTHSTFSVAV